jgi:hypothetical protein
MAFRRQKVPSFTHEEDVDTHTHTHRERERERERESSSVASYDQSTVGHFDGDHFNNREDNVRPQSSMEQRLETRKNKYLQSVNESLNAQATMATTAIPHETVATSDTSDYEAIFKQEAALRARAQKATADGKLDLAAKCTAMADQLLVGAGLG